MLFLKVKSAPSVLEFSTLAIDTTISWTNSLRIWYLDYCLIF